MNYKSKIFLNIPEHALPHGLDGLFAPLDVAHDEDVEGGQLEEVVVAVVAVGRQPKEVPAMSPGVEQDQ